MLAQQQFLDCCVKMKRERYRYTFALKDEMAIRCLVEVGGNMRTKRIALAVMLCLLSTPSEADTIDFTNSGGGGGLAIGAYDPIGQSFLATAPNLVSIGFKFTAMNAGFPIQPIELDLLDGNGLSGAILATKTLDLGTGDGTFDFAFSNISLVVGNTYTASLKVVGNSPYQGIAFSGSLGYDYGRLYTSEPLHPLCDGGGCDLAFRVTMVDAAPAIPEPATWGMISLGIFALGAVSRRAKADGTGAHA